MFNTYASNLNISHTHMPRLDAFNFNSCAPLLHGVRHPNQRQDAHVGRGTGQTIALYQLSQYANGSHGLGMGIGMGMGLACMIGPGDHIGVGLYGGIDL